MSEPAVTRHSPPDGAPLDSQLQAMLLHHEIESFNARYAQALDEQRLSDWAEMFTDDALYVILSRENYKRMIHDRAFALMETSMFAPRYLRHIIANQVVVSVESNGTIKSRANYVVLQVLFDRPDATLHQVGVYYDVFRRVGGELKLAERRCVYDNLLVSNALCIPV